MNPVLIASLSSGHVESNRCVRDAPNYETEMEPFIAALPSCLEHGIEKLLARAAKSVCNRLAALGRRTGFSFEQGIYG